VLVAAIWILPTPSRADDFFTIGEKVTVKTGWVGCRELADLDRAKDLAVRQHDIEAAARYTSSRSCRALDAGNAGIVEDNSIWHASTCLRARGDPYCYWFPTPFVSKARPFK
jgi:hypothetical protein